MIPAFRANPNSALFLIGDDLPVGDRVYLPDLYAATLGEDIYYICQPLDGWFVSRTMGKTTYMFRSDDPLVSSFIRPLSIVEDTRAVRICHLDVPVPDIDRENLLRVVNHIASGVKRGIPIYLHGYRMTFSRWLDLHRVVVRNRNGYLVCEAYIKSGALTRAADIIR